MHDSLTGLPNRRMMQAHLTNVLNQAAVDETHVALLFLDLDRFKLVNDTLGHTHGDELLVAVARRLNEHVRPSDLVTRIGGDEFMIVLGEVVNVSQALDLANRLRFSLRAPFMVNELEFYVSASIGLAFASGDDPNASAEVLVRDADTAMYQAKDAGRDAVAVFDESMRTKVSERVELEHDLRRAVELRQLHLVYQPIVCIPHGPIEGVEALVRWAHPTLGIIPPARFIPLAEESGLIMGIGEWVLEEAVRQLAAWRHQTTGFEDLYVAVNLSGAQLHDERLVALVRDALTHHEIEGSALCLELTESVVMDKPLAAAAVLSELRRLDVRLAIDDFGTEYSSLAYLKRFPVTSLKIDRSFVDTLEDEDSSDATLIAAVVAMAHALGITTIAEGVETTSQAHRLMELGCDALQGFLYSRPVRAEGLPYVVNSMWKKSEDVLEGSVS
jgi:diguanylate cyclase (GGDEF)-like protein